MEAQVKKWGNSLGIRIPKNMAKQLKIVDGSIIDIDEESGRIIITPMNDELSIAYLTQGMTKEGLNDQFEDYPSVGLESEI